MTDPWCYDTRDHQGPGTWCYDLDPGVMTDCPGVMTDFEAAEISTVREVFPQAIITGSFEII